MTRTVDLDQLTADIHDLTGHYTEHPTAGTRDRARQSLHRRLRAADHDLRDLGVPFTHGFPTPTRPPVHVRSLLALRGQLITQLANLDTPAETTGGLLGQLADPDRTRAGGGGERTRAGKPGSRPPGSLAAVDLLALIESAVWDHDADLRDLLQDHLNTERSWQQALDALAPLCRRLPGAETHPLTVAVARDVQSWRHTCRVLLGYTSPRILLQNDCPVCGQQTLRMSPDMDSDIVCTGQVTFTDTTGAVLPDREGLPLTVRCVDPDNGQNTRWSRHAWIGYLEQQHTNGMVTTEAAAYLAEVSGSTIRRWRAEGKITPVGGTAQHPLWARAEMLALRKPVPGQRSAPILESYTPADVA